ncbi:hypothetical protein CN680_16155 [Bacillus pseudomycoides]|uniref:DUF3953 domain-containing protein n=1 Tax=Bacillus pseudomycoides TaxID=64104 RepID=UPI000BED4F7A|nr:DUF3953 domain-containing protein [Bacillus pseudomycoides]PED72616.1 hypothetical protein CON97_08035 [Bacillus pseudomycoides]PEI39717.1 hypothetical protein CN620_18695 [Bacillus pseudomycoides]PEJ76898.1 hypothetical protein CN680_16155 [Bacillus pseudomycoides]PEM14840.1 hypothetical protein CN628_17900 [Bacillus pseudomycoides]PEP03374.1 hypothetical protein CN550_02865 [Bacillus pseudomycoides]
MLRILRLLTAFIVIIVSLYSLFTHNDSFLTLSHFFLGALMFIIAIEQIQKKDPSTSLTCMVAGIFVWDVLAVKYIM